MNFETPPSSAIKKEENKENINSEKMGEEVYKMIVMLDDKFKNVNYAVDELIDAEKFKEDMDNLAELVNDLKKTGDAKWIDIVEAHSDFDQFFQEQWKKVASGEYLTDDDCYDIQEKSENFLKIMKVLSKESSVPSSGKSEKVQMKTPPEWLEGEGDFKGIRGTEI